MLRRFVSLGSQGLLLKGSPLSRSAASARLAHGTHRPLCSNASSGSSQTSARRSLVPKGLAAFGAFTAAAGAYSAIANAEQQKLHARGRDFEYATTDQSSRRKLYPALEPYATGMLKVSDKHTLYYEECGNPKGKPVVFLHGGPGGGCNESHRCYFDPDAYRIILFDQRGSGRSKPHACLEENTTWDLVADIERVRNHLKVDRWQVFGGSWGSTLALAYAESHPERVTELVLRGIFMLRKKEIDWYYENKGGAEFIFPDEWERYLAPIPPAQRGNLVKAYNKLLTSDDREERLRAAKAWTGWEMATSYLMQNEESLAKGEEDEFAEAFARIENHYFINEGWFKPETQLLDNIGKIRNIPCVMVQGRYDVVCPMRSAWDLHRAWPEAKLVVVPDSGHSAKEDGILSELVAATDSFKHRR